MVYDSKLFLILCVMQLKILFPLCVNEMTSLIAWLDVDITSEPDHR